MVDYVKGDVPAADNVPMDELLELCKQAIGPLAVALGTDELSIMIGDSGHTVFEIGDQNAGFGCKDSAGKGKRIEAWVRCHRAGNCIPGRK